MTDATMTQATATQATPCPAGGTRTEYIKLSEAARLLSCHPSVVQRLALKGLIRTRTARGRVLFHAGDVEDAG
jgi:hypothetical protein